MRLARSHTGDDIVEVEIDGLGRQRQTFVAA